MTNANDTITAEERIAKLEAQAKAMLGEIEQLKKELAEEKAKNSKLAEENQTLFEENKSLKEQVKEWQDKWEYEHKLVIKLTEENEQLKTRIVELESQLDAVHKNNPGFNPDAIAEIYKLQDQIKELTSKLETTDQKVEETNQKVDAVEQKVEKIDQREMKSDSKILEMVNEVKESIKEEVKKEVYTCLGKPTASTKPETITVQKTNPEVKKPEPPKEEVKTEGGTVTPKRDPVNWKGFYDSLDDDF